MQSKPARELQVGDTFFRGYSPTSVPPRDQIYTVERVQFVPIRDFFGGLLETIQMDARNHLLGPTKLSVSADEEVWLVFGADATPPPAPPSSPGSRSGGRWGRRWRG